MFGIDFSLLKDVGIGVPDLMSIMNGDFAKASKLGTSLLVKYQPNMVDGMINMREKYNSPNIALILSVQHEMNDNDVLSPFICIDVCCISENSEVKILDSLPLTDLLEFLSKHYINDNTIH